MKHVFAGPRWIIRLLKVNFNGEMDGLPFLEIVSVSWCILGYQFHMVLSQKSRNQTGV